MNMNLDGSHLRRGAGEGGGSPAMLLYVGVGLRQGHLLEGVPMLGLFLE